MYIITAWYNYIYQLARLWHNNKQLSLKMSSQFWNTLFLSWSYPCGRLTHLISYPSYKTIWMEFRNRSPILKICIPEQRSHINVKHVAKSLEWLWKLQPSYLFFSGSAPTVNQNICLFVFFFFKKKYPFREQRITWSLDEWDSSVRVQILFFPNFIIHPYEFSPYPTLHYGCIANSM